MPARSALVVAMLLLAALPGVRAEETAPRGVLPFPCGLYGVEPESFPDVAAAGFNVVHSYRFETSTPASVDSYTASVREYLDAAGLHGLRVHVGLPRTWFLRGDADKLRSAILPLRHHPALLAWYEEEQGQQGRVDAVEFLSAVVEAADPEHGLVIEENRRRTELIDVGRARMFTYYPVSPKARRAGRLPSLLDRLPRQPLRIPCWPVLQAYGQDLITGCPKTDLAMPTRRELQYSLYSAVLHGASGIFIYSYSHPTRYDAGRKRAGSWPYMDYRPLPEVSPAGWSSVQAALGEASFLLLRCGSRLAPPSPVVLENPGWLESAQWGDRGENLVILANGRFTPRTLHITVPPVYQSWAILHATGLGSPQTIHAGRVTIEMPGPGGVAVVFSP